MILSATRFDTIQLFSIPHIAVLILLTLACFGIIFYRKKLEPYKAVIRWSLCIILVCCVISLQTYLVLTDKWKISDLPLNLCSLSTYLSIYLFFKNNNKVFNLLFFIGFIPPILSMLTPDNTYHFPHFRFIRYYLQHSAIALSVLYFIIFDGYRVPKKAIYTSLIILNIIAVPIYFLNTLLKTNFFFLARPAVESKTLLSYLGSGIMYYVNIELIAIVIAFLTYYPMKRLIENENKNGIREKEFMLSE